MIVHSKDLPRKQEARLNKTINPIIRLFPPFTNPKYPSLLAGLKLKLDHHSSPMGLLDNYTSSYRNHGNHHHAHDPNLIRGS